MRPAKIAKYAEMIYGGGWQTKLAKRWGFSTWTVNTWNCGKGAPPPRVYPQLIDDINAKILELVEARDEVKKMLRVDADPDKYLRLEIRNERRLK